VSSRTSAAKPQGAGPVTSSFASATTNTSWASSTGDSPPPGLAAEPGGALAYWHVDDVEAALERLVSLGATQLEGATERGPGFATASVVDPFGNVLGVMFKRHYLDMLGDRRGAR
jgi:predicted enzyme related to lactoylglutathione lyase